MSWHDYIFIYFCIRNNKVLNVDFIGFCYYNSKIHLPEKSFKELFVRIYVGLKCISKPGGKLKMHIKLKPI